MATIVLEGAGKSKDGRAEGKPYSVTATVTNPERTYRTTVNGIPRDFERVSTNASGQAVYRDQNRRPVR